jgi:hypothetical protein
MIHRLTGMAHDFTAEGEAENVSPMTASVQEGAGGDWCAHADNTQCVLNY